MKILILVIIATFVFAGENFYLNQGYCSEISFGDEIKYRDCMCTKGETQLCKNKNFIQKSSKPIVEKQIKATTITFGLDDLIYCEVEADFEARLSGNYSQSKWNNTYKKCIKLAPQRAKQLAEQQRIKNEKQLVEQQRIAEEEQKQLLEKQRIAEEEQKQLLEKQRIEKEKQLVEQQRIDYENTHRAEIQKELLEKRKTEQLSQCFRPGYVRWEADSKKSFRDPGYHLNFRLYTVGQAPYLFLFYTANPSSWFNGTPTIKYAIPLSQCYTVDEEAEENKLYNRKRDEGDSIAVNNEKNREYIKNSDYVKRLERFRALHLWEYDTGLSKEERESVIEIFKKEIESKLKNKT